ncbi:MAG: CBS domain-containing protein [Deltaproteobacteria bacterium]|jgi:CBS domain-containing protein|nr:CBS domain-containing protein [Deltaproteobacteria bacterium]
MFLDKHVKDLLIPLKDCATTHVDKPLREAINELRTVFCETETGKCTEAGHRTSLVLDDNENLVGILDFQYILEIMIPEIAGSLSQKLPSLGVSIAFAEGGAPELDDANQRLKQRVTKNAETKVGEIMLKLRGKNATTDMTLVDALKIMYRNKITVLPVYENDTLVGILRDSDLFLATANILSE